AVEVSAAHIIPPGIHEGAATAQEAPDGIVAPDVQDQILGSVVGPLLADHSAIGLVDAETAHAEVADRLTQVRRQVLLPGLTVADLVALGEAVAVSVNPAGPVHVHERSPGPVGPDGRGNRGTPVDAVRREKVAQDIAQLRVKPRPACRAAQEAIDHLPWNGAGLQKLDERGLFRRFRPSKAWDGKQHEEPQDDGFRGMAHGDPHSPRDPLRSLVGGALHRTTSRWVLSSSPRYE